MKARDEYSSTWREWVGTVFFYILIGVVGLGVSVGAERCSGSRQTGGYERPESVGP